MKSITTSGLKVYYDQDEIGAVDGIVNACERSVQTIQESWQLETPRDCRVYIMSSWPRCVFLGAPIGSQIILGLTFPVWYSEFKKRWNYSGGWSQKYGERQVVGIKSPRLFAEIPDAIGESIFIQEDDLDQKVLSIVCHELTHAYSSHLRLPNWMHEGLAMVSADRCLGKPNVLPDTLQLLKTRNAEQSSNADLQLNSQSRDEIILQYVRGYWMTKYLVDNHPELVIELLQKKLDPKELESKIASAVGIAQKRFWQEANERVYLFYNFELT